MQRASTPGLRARLITGNYTGNGVDDRDIDIGIDLLSKQNVIVQIKRIDSTQYTIFRTDYWTGVSTGSVIHTADAGVELNAIQALTATGFQIGNGARVNINTDILVYWVIWSEP